MQRHWCAAACAAGLAFSLLGGTANASTWDDDEERGRSPGAVVNTQSGLVRGVREGRFEQFLGLPYAAPPVRELRFAPPAAPKTWRGVRAADRQSPACLQFEPTGVREEQTLSEDCLYIDVYRPSGARERDRLPVMVWFHGGGNTQGTGVIYGGGSPAALTNTIVVTINYRLGALGFLAHPALSAITPGGSGNFATLDQMESLRWVRRNIGEFGGDPRNVTIYGQSAGGQAVCNLLAIPSAKGLFQRAIAQSSTCTQTRTTLAAGEASGVTYANAVGCTDPATVVTCLRKAFPGKLIAGQGVYLGGAKVGGELFPVAPAAAITAGNWNKVPVMTGTIKSEDRLTSQALWPMTAQGYVDRVNTLYGAKAPQVLELYPLSRFKTPYDAITQVTTDAGRACQTEQAAAMFAAQGVPTYRYEFNDPTSPTLYGFALPGEDMSNAHSGELQYLFDFTLGDQPLTNTQERLSEQMMRYWAAFARDGDPNFRGAPTWPTYGTGRVMQLRTGAASKVITTFQQEHNCAFWLS